MVEITSLMNIGKEMAKKLDSVGIRSAEELVGFGAEQTFLKLKERYPNVCLVYLYALEGAVCNVEFNSLSEGRKKELKEFSDFWFYLVPGCGMGISEGVYYLMDVLKWETEIILPDRIVLCKHYVASRAHFTAIKLY